MFTFYDTEVFKNDWLVVFEKNGQVTRIHNDRDALKRYLSSVQFLVGFNNYHYDDLILCGLLKNMNPYEISIQILNGKKPRFRLNNPLTLDVMQEMKMGVSLKECQANMGMSIVEPPIDFNLNRYLTEKELERTFRYCENDVLTTKKLFEKREPYFASKFEIVKTFSLQAPAVKHTRARLAASVLKARKNEGENDRLKLKYDKRIPLNEIPKEIIDFYKSIEEQYTDGVPANELEKQKLAIELCGIKHTLGFGGLHGAIDNFVHEGNMMQVDVSSYYPTLIINNGFMSRASTRQELYEDIYKRRIQLKEKKDPKEEVYKIVLNATFGAMKSEYNPLYDPVQFNNVTVNGQLILVHLILLLEPFVRLIQTNTDGIIIKYDNHMKEPIVRLLTLFEGQYQISFDIDLIKKIAQRDVNNYAVQYLDGTVKAKGRMANFEGGNFERNSLAIIDKALVDYYIHDIPVHKTIIASFKKNELDCFQLVAKAGNTFDGIVHEVNGKMVPVQKVSRVFATNDKRLGSIYKTKKVDGNTKFSKIPMTSERVLVHNDDLNALDKRKIDLNYYIQLAKNNLFV